MLRLKLTAVPLLTLLAAQTLFGQKEPSRTQIIAEIQSRLLNARVFERGDVQVGFENGVATLTGTVDSLGVKRDAERATRKVDEVMQLVNNIQVSADDVSVRQILEEARKQIVTYYAYGIFDNIALEAQGGKLIVIGQVSEPFKKGDIGNFLAHVKGVAEVENNLEVLPTSIYDDQLRWAVARAIYNDPYFIRYANRANPPIHIIVKNGNVTLEGVVGSAMDRAKAEQAARLAATYFGFTNNLRVDGK
jgi:hyperosmotically inducible protein